MATDDNYEQVVPQIGFLRGDFQQITHVQVIHWRIDSKINNINSGVGVGQENQVKSYSVDRVP